MGIKTKHIKPQSGTFPKTKKATGKLIPHQTTIRLVGSHGMKEVLLDTYFKLTGILPGIQHATIERLYSDSEYDKEFRNLSNLTQLPVKFLAEYVFEITPKTYNTYKTEEKKLPKHILEKSLKIQELYENGIALFGTVGGFNEWMKRKSYGLGQRIPLDLINTITGIDLIYDELVKIEFGATA